VSIWDDTQSQITAAQAAYAGGSTAAASGDDSPQVYMGRTSGEPVDVTWGVKLPRARLPKGSSLIDGDPNIRPPRTVRKSVSTTFYPDDIRTSDEAHGLMLAWHGTDRFTQWGQKLLGLGLIDAGDETSVEILDAVWQDAVDLAARFLASGKKVTPWQAAELMAIGGRGAAELAGRLIDFQCSRFGQPDATIGDAGAVCAVIDRAGLSTTRLPVRVELAGTYSRGRTIVDRRDWSGDIAHDPHGMAATSVEVALSVDADRYAELWLRTVNVGRR